MELNTDWSSIGLSGDLLAGDVHPIELNETEYALWRDGDGGAHVWLDRCPHRGMRLSFGFVRENRLTCLYHGWQFGADGECKKIPAHPDLDPPKTLCTDVREVREAFGMIWIGQTGEDAPSSEEQWHSVRSVFLNVGLETAQAQLVHFGGRPLSRRGQVLISDDGSIALGIQPRSETQSALHLATTNPDSSHRLGLARELVALRRAINSKGST